MTARQHSGATAPGLATPEGHKKDETRELGSGAGFDGQQTESDGVDCAANPAPGGVETIPALHSIKRMPASKHSMRGAIYTGDSAGAAEFARRVALVQKKYPERWAADPGSCLTHCLLGDARPVMIAAADATPECGACEGPRRIGSYVAEELAHLANGGVRYRAVPMCDDCGGAKWNAKQELGWLRGFLQRAKKGGAR